MNRNEFVATLRAATPMIDDGADRQMKPWSFRYGYARASVVPPQPEAQGFTHPYVCRGRKEGDPGDQFRDDPQRAEFTKAADAVAWCVDVLKTGRTCEVGRGVGIRELDTWPTWNPTDIPWEFLARNVAGEGGREGWDLNPDYQRGHVWTDAQAMAFIGHCIEGGQVPLVFVQRYDSRHNAPKGVDYLALPCEVIDGQQRVRAILRWMKGEIAAELTDGRLVWYRDTNEIDRRCLPNLKVAFLDVDRATRLRFYLRLNRGGTVHTDAEIARVRKMLAEEEVR